MPKIIKKLLAASEEYTDFSPRQIARYWLIFVCILLATLIAQFFVHPHPHFGIDGLFSFHAWFSVLTCVGIVVLSKLLGFWLKRPEDYYEKNHDAN